MYELILDVPWLAEQRFGELSVRAGADSLLRYDDGIELAVDVIEPSEYANVDQLVERAQAAQRPGNVVLVAGAVPVSWRPTLRSNRLSFIDTSGVGYIEWPRISLETGQFAKKAERVRVGLPLQKSHATVVQSLLQHHFYGSYPTVSDLAADASVSLSSASRTVSKLEEFGLALRSADGNAKRVGVSQPLELAKLLSERSAWPNGESLAAYQWGSTVDDVTARLADSAKKLHQVDIAVTGRAALQHVGLLATSAPTTVHVWVRAPGRESLEDVARDLDLEPVSRSESNVQIARDRWGLSAKGSFDNSAQQRVPTASPLRIWCDIQSEPRGTEFAAGLWPLIDQRGSNDEGRRHSS